jgi:small subunit ribosomal protein S4
MGDPRRFRRKFKPPRHPWEKKRIKEENKLIKDFGLKNKREIWKAKTEVAKYRYRARELVGISAEDRKKKEGVLLGKLVRLGILNEDQGLDDVLELTVENLLERRLQTIVWKKGIASTPKQARQLITHGHISVKGRKVSVPSRIIDVETEKEIGWYGKPLKIEIRKPVEVKVEKKEEKKIERPKKEEAKEEKKEEVKKEVKCPECGKTFKSERGLKIHKKVHE